MTKSKVTYIVSNIDKAIAFEWIAKGLIDNEIRISFILLNPYKSALVSFLVEQKIPHKVIPFSGSKALPKAIISVYHHLRVSKPDVVHCHMFHATIVGLLAARILGIKKRIYTRHHSSYNWDYNPKGVWFDKFINWLSTDIVAISQNVKTLLVEKENVKPEKVKIIQHGFDIEAFSNVSEEDIASLQKRYNPDLRHPVVGIIARWIKWKGIQYIIPALRELLHDYPNAFFIFANARGPFKKVIAQLLTSLPADSYCTIQFEDNLFALYHLFDVYVHAPIDSRIEAFGQTYVESLAAGIPSIFTISGVASEFVENEKNALIVPYKNSEAIYKAVKRLLEDHSLHKSLSDQGKASLKKFSLINMIDKLVLLYQKNGSR